MDELTQKYRHVFLSPFGRDVLADILQMCHFGCTLDADNKQQVSEYGVGVAILAKCGIFSPGTMPDVINALCSVSPKKEEENE